MNKNHIILTTLFLLSFGCFSEGGKIEFDDQVFVEKFSNETENEILREFIRDQDTLENWEKLLSYRRFPKIKKPKNYVKNLVTTIRSNPMNMCEVYQKDKMYLVDFLVHAPDFTFSEWNLMKVIKSKDGVEVYQYAYRMKGSDWAEHLKSERKRIGDLMGNNNIEIVEVEPVAGGDATR